MRFWRDVRHAHRLKPRAWADLATAAAELAMARIRLAVMNPARLTQPVAAGGAATIDDLGRDRLVDRVAFSIPRMGARVPWRSDCLVQALAAQRWLRRHGVRSSLVVGARKPAPQALDAHAWLEVDGRVVVGGEPGKYTPFAPRQTG